MIRTFVAIEVVEPLVVSKILEMENSLSALQVPAKTVEPENLHITLVFIGEVEDELVKDIMSALQEVKYGEIRASLKGIGAFPDLRSPRVIWAGVDRGKEKIVELQKLVANSLRKYNIKFEQEKKFEPHLTLARIKGSKNIERLREFIKMNADIEIGEVVFNELKLKQSILTPKGPIYKDLFVQKLS